MSSDSQTYDLVVVSNRLPVDSQVGPDGEISWVRSPGGLVTALESVTRGTEAAWVGWPDSTWWHPLEAYLRKEIDIPPEFRVASLVAVGHPAEARPPHTREERFDATKIHEERWGNRRVR